MSWEKESVLILVKAAPNWSTKYKQYEVCTAGISNDEEWRRLYPFPEDVMHREDIHVWDKIEVETTTPNRDPRLESRKIRPESIRKIGRVEDREERRKILRGIAEPSLDIPKAEKRTMMLVKPRIESFHIQKRPQPEIIQLTLNGKPFRRNPYGDVGLYYKWRCPKPCEVCKARLHLMECFDWGANVLYKRYKDEREARFKTKDKCYFEMKHKNDTWFALGTHSRRPWRIWMIVGLLWMKKAKPYSDAILKVKRLLEN